jgi:hypothetical protein
MWAYVHTGVQYGHMSVQSTSIKGSRSNETQLKFRPFSGHSVKLCGIHAVSEESVALSHGSDKATDSADTACMPQNLTSSSSPRGPNSFHHACSLCGSQKQWHQLLVLAPMTFAYCSHTRISPAPTQAGHRAWLIDPVPFLHSILEGEKCAAWFEAWHTCLKAF